MSQQNNDNDEIQWLGTEATQVVRDAIIKIAPLLAPGKRIDTCIIIFSGPDGQGTAVVYIANKPPPTTNDVARILHAAYLQASG